MSAFKRAALLAALSLTALFAQNSARNQQQLKFHADKAARFLKSNQPDLALREFAAILLLDPNNFEAHANLGALLFFQSDYKAAVPELRAALKLRPDQVKIETLLGLGEWRTGETDRARENLEHCFPHLGDPKLRIEAGKELAEIYYARSDLEKAAAVISTLRTLSPADPDLLYTAHRIYSDLAEEAMLSLAMTAPDSARAHQMTANEMARRGNLAAAVGQYRAALKADPNLPGIHFQLAEALATSSAPSDVEEAAKQYEAALLENPQDTKSECRLGDLALARGEIKLAEARYTRAIHLQPADADANFGLGKTLTQAGKPGQAEPYLLRAATSEPYNAAMHIRLANLYRQSGNSAKADEQLAEFRRLKLLKEKLGDAYRDMRGYDTAASSPKP